MWEGERRKGEGEGEEERRRGRRVEKRLRKCKAHLDDERSGYRWRRRGWYNGKSKKERRGRLQE